MSVTEGRFKAEILTLRKKSNGRKNIAQQNGINMERQVFRDKKAVLSFTEESPKMKH